jgi:hypothetical protein
MRRDSQPGQASCGGLVTKCIEINLHFAFMPLFQIGESSSAKNPSFQAAGRICCAATPKTDQVERHMAQDGEVVRAVIVAISRLVLVHDGVENSVKPVFDTAMQTCDLAKAFGRQRGAEQV